MVNENLKTILENKKPFETVYELKDEYKTPSFEEFMESYEYDNLSCADLVGSDIGESEGYGPCTDGRNKIYCYCSKEEIRVQINNNTYNVNIIIPPAAQNPDDKACRIRLNVASRVYFYLCASSNRFLTNYSSSQVSWAERRDSTIPGDSHLRYYTKELIITSLEQLKELRLLVKEGDIQMLTNETSQGSTSSEKENDIKMLDHIISRVKEESYCTAYYSFSRYDRKEDCIIQ